MRHLPNVLLFGGLFLATAWFSCDTKPKTEKTPPPAGDEALSDIQLLGKKIFFDGGFSNPKGQSCATCHSPGKAFADSLGRAFSEGAVKGRFGNRNAPGISYAMYSPPLFYDEKDATFIGGLFLDGRQPSLEEQAVEPLMSHLEMNAGGKAAVAKALSAASYKNLFVKLFGEQSLQDSTEAFKGMARALAAFERSAQVNPFSSKYDAYLAGKAVLSDQEARGLALFNDTARAKCVNCHPSSADEANPLVLFTDFTYDNVGLPANPNNPDKTKDLGLFKTTKKEEDKGKFRVPTLRNVALTAPYFHAGSFEKLEEAIRFYSERDLPGKFGPAEVPENVNTEELGNLKLSEQEISDIAAFLRTLSDGYEGE